MAGKEQASRRTWTCMMCTWENSFKWLRCSVCDNVRGSTLPAAEEQNAHDRLHPPMQEASNSLQGLPGSAHRDADSLPTCSSRAGKDAMTGMLPEHAPAASSSASSAAPKRKRAHGAAAVDKPARTPALTSFFKPKP